MVEVDVDDVEILVLEVLADVLDVEIEVEDVLVVIVVVDVLELVDEVEVVVEYSGWSWNGTNAQLSNA